MARTIVDRVERLEDGLVLQANSGQARQQTLDQVVLPFIKAMDGHLEARDERIVALERKVDKILTAGAVLMALLTLGLSGVAVWGGN